MVKTINYIKNRYAVILKIEIIEEREEEKRLKRGMNEWERRRKKIKHKTIMKGENERIIKDFFFFK